MVMCVLKSVLDLRIFNMRVFELTPSWYYNVITNNNTSVR